MQPNLAAQSSKNLDFPVAADYKGSRDFTVPVRMYRKAGLMHTLGLKSKRWLRVDLNDSKITFHKHMLSTDPKEELHFSNIRSVDADFTKGDRSKYYLRVQTDNEHFKFKFKNLREFFAVVNALKSVLRPDQAVYVTKDEYVKAINLHSETLNKPMISHTSSVIEEITSDEDKEYELEKAATNASYLAHSSLESEYDYLKWKYDDRFKPGYGQVPDKYKTYWEQDTHKDGFAEEKARYESRRNLYIVNPQSSSTIEEMKRKEHELEQYERDLEAKQRHLKERENALVAERMQLKQNEVQAKAAEVSAKEAELDRIARENEELKRRAAAGHH